MCLRLLSSCACVRVLGWQGMLAALHEQRLGHFSGSGVVLDFVSPRLMQRQLQVRAGRLRAARWCSCVAREDLVGRVHVPAWWRPSQCRILECVHA